MGSSTRTYTNLQLQPLMDDDTAAYDDAMLNVYKQNLVGFDKTLSVYGKTISSNKSLFNSGFLDALGFDPAETATRYVLDNAKLLAWAKTNVDSSISSVRRSSYAPLTSRQASEKYLSGVYSDYSFDTKRFTHTDGSEYTYYGEILVSIDILEVSAYRNREDTVDDYVSGLNSNADVDESYTVISYGTRSGNPQAWNTELRHTYVVTTPATDPNTEPTTSVVTEVISERIPVDILSIQIPTTAASLVPYVTSTWESRRKTITVRNLFHDSIRFIYDMVPTVVVTGASSFTVTIDMDITYVAPYDGSGYEERDQSEYEQEAAAFKAELEAEIKEYVKQNASYLYFQYTTTGSSRTMVYADIISSGTFETISSTEMLESYPIIPIKRRKVFSSDSTKRKVLLNKLGMQGNEFEESLADNDIYSAYLVFGIDINDTTTYGQRYVFEALDVLTSSQVDNMQIQFSGLSISTELSATKTVKVSTEARPVGTYWDFTYTTVETRYELAISSGDDPNSWVYVDYETLHRVKCKQISTSSYKEIDVYAFGTTYNVDGKINEPVDDSALIPILYDVVVRLPLKEFMYVLSRSLQLLVLTRIKVKTKWYRSGLFKFVMLIGAVGISAISFGTAAPWSFAAYASVVSMVVAVASYLGLLQGTLGTALSVVSVAYGGYAGLTSTSTSVGIQTLQLANVTVQIASLANQIQLYGVDGAGGKIGAIREEAESKQEELEETERLAKEVEDSTYKAIMMPQITHKYADTYYTMALGEIGYNYDIMYDYSTVYSTSTVPDLM